MIFAIVFILFVLSVTITGMAINRNNATMAAFGGTFTGMLVLPVVVQIIVLLM